MFFRANWISSDQELASFLSNYEGNCVALGCFIDVEDGMCQCPINVEMKPVFEVDDELISIENVLSKTSIGSLKPTIAGEDVVGVTGIKKYPGGNLTAESVFEFVDEYGKKKYRKNKGSKVLIGQTGELQLRTPVSFFSVAEYTLRDAEYELDAALEQYFYHQNTGEFWISSTVLAMCNTYFVL
jgi:hypothetical protein